MSPMFVPGPVDVAPEVLTAQTKPMLPHRSKDFEAMFKSTEERLKKVFFTEQPVYQITASGSGMQEGGIRNFVQESVLSCINGAFADRWYKVAIANGKQADKVEAPWGQPITPEQVADALKKKHYEAITVVHNETSTGVESPIKAIAEVVHKVSPDTLILVDAVSSLSGVKIEFDAWGLDFLLTSSQKCFALPPGMSFAAASARAMKKAETVTNRGWYFRSAADGKTPRQGFHPDDTCHGLDLCAGCPARSHPGRRARESLRAPRRHGRAHPEMVHRPRHAAAGTRGLSAPRRSRPSTTPRAWISPRSTSSCSPRACASPTVTAT